MSTRGRSLLAGACAAAALVLGMAPGAPATAAPGAAAQCFSTPGRTLVVATVPKVVGFVFAVGNRHYRTGESGKVRIDPVTCADPEAALGPISGPIDQGDRTTANFDGWFSSQILGRTRGDGVIYASFRQSIRVDLSLEDLAGKPVPRDQVGDIVIKGSTGAEISVPRDKSSVELDASRVVRFSTGLVSKDILWSVQSAAMDGNTAVNRGQTRFEPRHKKDVTIPLMLYPLRVQVHDVILHRAVGDEVILTAPDGSTRDIALGDRATGGLPALSRGHYVLQATGSSIAMGFKQPVAVSRPQAADLTVISYVDMAIAAAVLLLTVVGLFLVGWLMHRRGRAAEPPPGSGPSADDAPMAPDAPDAPDAPEDASDGAPDGEADDLADDLAGAAAAGGTAPAPRPSTGPRGGTS